MKKVFTFEILMKDGTKKTYTDAAGFDYIQSKFLYVEYPSTFTPEKPGRKESKGDYILLDDIKSMTLNAAVVFETEKERAKMEMEVDNG